MLNWRVRQHDTQAIRAGIHAGELVGIFSRCKHDGARVFLQVCFGKVGQINQALGNLHIPTQQGEGFVFAMLEFTQTFNCLRIVSTDSKVESADAFDTNDPTGREHGSRLLIWITFNLLTTDIHQSHLWTTVVAGSRLSMESAIARVGVLLHAGQTHLEHCHRCAGAVIGDISDDGEPWTTVGAVDQAVAMAFVVRIAHLRQTVGADGSVDGHGLVDGFGATVPLNAGTNLKRTVNGDIFDRDVLKVKAVIVGQLGAILLNRDSKPLNRVKVPLDFNPNPLRFIAHKPTQAQIAGQTEHKRAKPNPLHLTLNLKLASSYFFGYLCQEGAKKI